MSFSIKQLLILTLFVAAGLTALANAGRPWMPGTVQMLVFTVLAAIAYGIWFTSGERRAFRIGFLCWVVAMGTYGMTGAGNPYFFFQATVEAISPMFLPKAYAAPGVIENPFGENPFDENPFGVSTGSYPGLVHAHLWQRNFNQVCDSLFPLVWGLIGGYVTVFCYRKKQKIDAANSTA